jgi:signal transduction histidine kinase
MSGVDRRSGRWAELWRAWVESFDPDQAITGSHPSGIVVSVASITVVFGILGYYPPLARSSRLEHAWIPIGFAFLAGASTFTAWRHRCRGTVGSIATLLDTTAYGASVTYAATVMDTRFGIGMAISYALLFLAMPAQVYGLTWVFAVAMALPPACFICLFRPAAIVVLILAGAWAMTLVMARSTGALRQLRQRQQRFEQALGETDRLAHDSLEAALAAKLVTFGQFLQELRDHQRAVAANVAAIERDLALDEELRATLDTVKTALAAEQSLVDGVLGDLRARTQSEGQSFSIREVVDGVVAETHAVELEVEYAATDVRLRGVPNRLRIVLKNLVRNAAQAGARRVLVQVSEPASSNGCELTVSDDGPGIPLDGRERLFEPFHTTSKPSGTGLGLYLCRRYLELTGGTIALVEGRLGGATFRLRWPGAGATAS